MPLFANASALIRANLEEISQGRRARIVAVGTFTADQFKDINDGRAALGLPLLESPEIVFLGGHVYKSRVIGQQYTIDDVVLQIEAAMAPASKVLLTWKMTAMKSTTKRKDGYGNEVLDEAVFELTQRKPRAELYSVIPRGDKILPKDIRSVA